jgi:D-threo-aldose 1-dehydrogenase
MGRASLRAFGPRVGLGTAPLGGLYAPVPEADALGVIEAAYAAGVRYFDTAPLYGHGLAERRLGTALAGVPRATYWLSSKVGYVLPDDQPAPAGFPLPRPPRDYRAAALERSLEASLRRLRTTYLDLVLVHDPDDPALVPVIRDETGPTLMRWRAAGTVRAIGIGTNHVDTALRLLDAADWDALLVAGRYTLLDRSAAATLFPEAQRRGLAIIVGGLLNSGILGNPWDAAPPYNYQPAPAVRVAQAQALAQTCTLAGTPLLAAALQFPGRHPAVTTSLLSARSRAEWDTNWAHWHHPVPPALWTILEGWASLLAPL